MDIGMVSNFWFECTNIPFEAAPAGTAADANIHLAEECGDLPPLCSP